MSGSSPSSGSHLPFGIRHSSLIRHSSFVIRHFVLLLALCTVPAATAAETPAPDTWWNPGWAFRQRVRVRLPAVQPFSFAYIPPQVLGEDLVAAEATLRCGATGKAGTASDIRVVDSGGNLLPAVVDGPDARGLVRVTFPARRTIAGQLADPIQAATKTVRLSVGRDKAVTVGTRFFALSGPNRVASLQVDSVADKSATARVLEKTVPTVAVGSPVRSEDLTDAEYFIYYGNPKPQGESPTWRPAVAPVTEFIWRLPGETAPMSVAQLQTAMRAGPDYVGMQTASQINARAAALNLDADSQYMVAYDSYVYAPLGGLYRFSLDTDGAAFLFLDGRFAAQRTTALAHRTRQWEHRGKIYLDAGYHLLTLFIGEGVKAPVNRLGWQPISAKVYDLVPPSFFVNRIGAEIVGLEARDARAQTFFTYRAAPRSILAGEGRRYQFVQFRNLTTIKSPAEADPVTCLWDFGDGEQSRDLDPGHLFAIPASGSADFPVTLRTYLGDRPAGEYPARVYCDPTPGEKLDLAYDVVSFANIVYADECTNVAVRVRNPGFSPVILRTVGRLTGRDGVQTLLHRSMTVPAQDEDFCILPVDLKQIEDKRAGIQLDFFLGNERVKAITARIVPSPQEIEAFHAELGALYDAEGRRIMLSTEIENADRHLRWVFFRYLRDELYAPQAKTRRRVLLFGDRMANPVPADQSFTDYVTLLDRDLPKDGRSIQFVPRSTGLFPTLADLVVFAKALPAADPPPDIVILSPGLADVEQGIDPRDFARSIDVFIDILRATGRPIKPIIVSPPPYPANPRLSEHYTHALEAVARDHHIPFLDLDALLRQGAEDWQKAGFAAPDAEGILYPNPNEAAHRRIAEQLLKLIY